jgi:ferrochelatase
MSESKYDAILLASFGGPESPEEVMPFLERVTAGRGVPRERLEEVSHHYLALGGVSPINQQNRALLSELASAFARNGIALPIYWGNRNSDPYFADTLLEMDAAGHAKVLMIATSAYSSYSGCRQYREDLAGALDKSGLSGKMVVDKIRHYFDHPGFIAPFTAGTAAAVAELQDAGFETDQIQILFTTHSIPNAMSESSGNAEFRSTHPAGAYVAQHMAACNLVMSDLAAASAGSATPNWQLVYQSRSGSPSVPWLEPDIGDAIRALATNGTKAIVVVPIGFVSDHVEVIWDLDNEAKEIADELGLGFIRVATPGTDPAFVQAVCDLVQERAANGEKSARSDLGPWPDFCRPECCPNLRAQKPVVAEG